MQEYLTTKCTKVSQSLQKNDSILDVFQIRVQEFLTIKF